MVELLVKNWKHLLPKFIYLNEYVQSSPKRLELNSITYETYNPTT